MLLFVDCVVVLLTDGAAGVTPDRWRDNLWCLRKVMVDTCHSLVVVLLIASPDAIADESLVSLLAV